MVSVHVCVCVWALYFFSHFSIISFCFVLFHPLSLLYSILFVDSTKCEWIIILAEKKTVYIRNVFNEANRVCIQNGRFLNRLPVLYPLNVDCCYNLTPCFVVFGFFFVVFFFHLLSFLFFFHSLLVHTYYFMCGMIIHIQDNYYFSYTVQVQVLKQLSVKKRSKITWNILRVNEQNSEWSILKSYYVLFSVFFFLPLYTFISLYCILSCVVLSVLFCFASVGFFLCLLQFLLKQFLHFLLLIFFFCFLDVSLICFSKNDFMTTLIQFSFYSIVPFHLLWKFFWWSKASIV